MAEKMARKPRALAEPASLSWPSFGDLLLGMAGVGEAAEPVRPEPVLTGRPAKQGRGGATTTVKLKPGNRAKAVVNADGA